MSERSPSQTDLGLAKLSPARRRLFQVFALAGVVTVLSLMSLGAEFTARYYERHRTTPPDYFPSIFYPHKRLRYGLIPNLDYYGWFKINSLGFRGREVSQEKQPGLLRIVCLGGSTTFELTIGKNHPWPEVLETELQRHIGTRSIEVLNLGIPGATSLDSLIDLQMRAMLFRPDLVILYQAHNDFIYSIPPPAGRSSDLFPLEDRPRGHLERWMTIHSLLYAKTEGRLADSLARITAFLPRGAEANVPSIDRDQAIAQGLSTFRANLKSIVAIARANGITLALPQIIVPFPPTEPGARACRACEGLSDAYGGLALAQVKSTMDAYNHVLEQLGVEPGVHFIPTGGFVPAADRYYHDSVHFSPEGSIRMGTALAEALAPIVGTLAHASAPLP